MAKTKTQKEIIAAVRNSPLTTNYDLTNVDPREYAAPLNVLFNSDKWKDIFIRRNSLYRAAMKGDANAFKQMDQIDRKVALLILQSMFEFSMNKRYEQEGKVITLHEYFTDFVRTDEQHELYDSFNDNLDSAIVLSDILDSIMTDAYATLRKLDPSCVLSEFKGIKQAMSALKDFSHIHHRDENDELNELHIEHADECEEYLRMKTALYVKKYREKRQQLVSNGKIQDKKVKKLSDREHCIELLANHFFIQSGHEAGKGMQDHDKAKKAINQFSDKEIPEVMEVVIALYKSSEAVHIAKLERNAIIKSLPTNDTTKKIVANLL